MSPVRFEDLPFSKQEQIRDALDNNVEEFYLTIPAGPAPEAATGPTTRENKHLAKRGWIELGGKQYFMRSAWERNFARYLNWRMAAGEIRDWLYEPVRFEFLDIRRGSNSYLPDFLVIETGKPFAVDQPPELEGINPERRAHYWVEVKGHFTQSGRTRIKRFLKRYPGERLQLIGEDDYRAMARELKNLIPGWER